MKKTHKSKETKERLKKAFFDLYAERKIETITIKEVTGLAGFNRGTFYLYYKSIYDLLQQTEQELLDNFEKQVNLHLKIYSGNININDDKSLEELQSKFLKDSEYLKILNSENGDPRFKNKMKNIIKNVYRKHTINDNAIRVSKFEYLLEYLVESNISIIQYWLTNREKNSPRITLKDVGEIMEFVGQHGFKKAITHFMDK